MGSSPSPRWLWGRRGRGPRRSAAAVNTRCAGQSPTRPDPGVSLSHVGAGRGQVWGGGQPSPEKVPREPHPGPGACCIAPQPPTCAPSRHLDGTAWMGVEAGDTLLPRWGGQGGRAAPAPCSLWAFSQSSCPPPVPLPSPLPPSPSCRPGHPPASQGPRPSPDTHLSRRCSERNRAD